MTVALVQKNGASVLGTASPTMPAWGSTTTAGNLLLVVISSSIQASGAWSGTPSTGYTVIFATGGQQYDSTGFCRYAIFWKIAAGSEATPSAPTAPSGTNDWVAYTYEFSATSGWIASAFDTEMRSATSSTLVTSKASGSTATLAQADELAVAVASADVAVTGLTFTNGYTNEQPGTNNGKLWFAWQETAATTAQSTTASWTGSHRAGCRVATFMPTAAAPPVATFELGLLGAGA